MTPTAGDQAECCELQTVDTETGVYLRPTVKVALLVVEPHTAAIMALPELMLTTDMLVRVVLLRMEMGLQQLLGRVHRRLHQAETRSHRLHHQ